MNEQNWSTTTFAVGPLGCNCSIIACTHTREAIVIDPGGDADRILSVIKDNDLNVKSIVHTHAHFDHCMATKEVAAASQHCTVHLHKDDLFMYKMLAKQGMFFGIEVDEDVRPIDHWLENDDYIEFGHHRLNIMHTPGHSPGSCCFSFSADKSVLYSGDTLFAGGIGRTDLWGGDQQKIMDSIKNRIMNLDRETAVIPGHGPATSIEIEKKTNPFL